MPTALQAPIFQVVTPETAPSEKRPDLEGLRAEWGPFLAPPKTLCMQTAGADKPPINGGITLTRLIPMGLNSLSFNEAIKRVCSRHFEKVLINCAHRPIHSAVRFSSSDRTVYVHKPTSEPNAADATYHALLAFNEFFYSTLGRSQQLAFEKLCPANEPAKVVFAREFRCWLLLRKDGVFPHIQKGSVEQIAARNSMLVEIAARFTA